MGSILELAKSLECEMIENRRHFHANPEIGFELSKTTAYIIKKLTQMGLEPKEIGNSGVVLTIGKGGKTILLRGDMDALAIKENNDLPFKSRNDYGHLCGHDMHMAMLLGASKLLKQKESELKGTVKILFQPNEEYGLGAKDMVEAGVLENPRVDAAMALHVSPDMNPGKVCYKKGIATASIDGFFLDVQGKGGHGSTPHLSVDPLMIVNTIYMLLNSLVGKEVDPFETAVLTIGKCGGGTALNIIPDTAKMEFGLRCFNKDVREHLKKRIHEIIDSAATTMRGTYTLTQGGTASVNNDEALCDFLNPYIAEIIGADNIMIAEKPVSASEDFSYYSEEVPSMLIWLGAGHNDNYPLHNPKVIFDEKALPMGAAVLVNCTMNWLKDNHSFNLK